MEAQSKQYLLPADYKVQLLSPVLYRRNHQRLAWNTETSLWIHQCGV